MNNGKGERMHAFSAGKTIWISIWKNRNSETGNEFTTTNITHKYQDKETGEYKPSTNYSELELARLEAGIREARQRLSITDHSKETKIDSEQEKKDSDQQSFQQKEANRRTQRKSAKTRE